MAGFWRKCRFAFRCVRYVIWGTVVLALAAFAWFNIVGLPGFLKTRLVTALHERGVSLEFTRMRLRIVHGLICDNVRIGAVQEADGPALTAKEVQIRISFAALLHRRLQVDGLVLHQGKFNLPLSANDSLALTNLESELRFETDDTWSLDQFRADFAGTTLTLGGEINHAPECRNWKIFAGTKTVDHGSMQSSLKSFSETLKQIHFEGKPTLNARLHGDARDVHSFTFALNARAPGVHTPWFDSGELQFTARVLVPTNAPATLDPAWGFWTNLQPFGIEWTVRGMNLKTAQLEMTSLETTGSWAAPQLAVTKLAASLGSGELNASTKLDVATRGLDFTASSSFDLHALAALLTDKIRSQLAQITWTQPPQIHANGSLVMPAWTNRSSSWPDYFDPQVRLHGDLAFTNTTVAGMPLFNSVQTHFNYVDLNWNLPDFELIQGRTTLELCGEENERTKDFRCVLGGKLDAESVLPFLTASNATKGFGHLYFREPAALLLDVTGNLRKFDTLSVTGRVVATDFAIRGQWVDSVTTTLTYTNLTGEFYNPELIRASGAEKFSADQVTLDLAGQKLFIHHGRGHVLPSAVGEAIGPKTAKAMEPYEFLTIPEATVDGCIPLKHVGDDIINDDADLRVNVVGTAPFRWRRFQTPAITGTIHWLSNYLILTNVVSECYGGTAHGWGRFDVQTPGDGTDFSFYMEGTNVNFNAMGRALWSPTNSLRGSLSGKVTVTSANSSDWRTWNGYGQAQLRDGLLWDAPIFGLMSPVLNTVTPGLDMGNSRATDGTGRFTMTKGVIFTDSLEIRSLTMRLQYVGTVDLDENVDARVKAQLLRNTPVVGSLFSWVLSPVSKAFECQVTGTLEQPKITPLYIPFPKVLAAPLHPIRTVEQIFAPPATNNPAKP